MPDPRVAIAVTTWNNGQMLRNIVAHLPPATRHIVVNTKTHNWPLARGWNYGIDILLGEGFQAVVVMNDDVALRPDTADLLAWGLLDGQFDDDRGYASAWEPDRPELLILSGRHASPSASATDVPDWNMLAQAAPQWQPGPDFSCFCVGRKLFEVAGRFDEEFQVFFEDNSAHRRCQMAGYEAGALAPMWHLLNGTIRSNPERLAQASMMYEASKRKYCDMWGAPYDDQLPMGRETYRTKYNR